MVITLNFFCICSGMGEIQWCNFCWCASVQFTIAQLCKCKHECKWLECKDQAMSRLFLTLAQARFLNWALKHKLILTEETYRLVI